MPLARRLKGLLDSSAGFTLIELSVALAGLAVVATVMLSFFVAATRVDELHTADDSALEQLRDARQRMSRDVREARRFTAIGTRGFSVWIDEGWDEVIGGNELVTWTLDGYGDLTRSTDSTSRIEASGLSYADSWFAFDEVIPASVTSMAMHVVVPVDGPSEGSRTLDTEITLRNVP